MNLLVFNRALNLRRGSKRHDDDVVDRLNASYSVAILILFAVIVSRAMYVGSPIKCWCPAQFTGNYVAYADRVCWVSNTYYVPRDGDIPDLAHLKPHLSYYQWTPFILLFSAFLFYIPHWLWWSLNDRSGLSINEVTSIATKFSVSSSESEKSEVIDAVTQYLDSYLESRHLTHAQGLRGKLRGMSSIFGAGRKQKNYITILYLFYKLFSLCICVGHIFMYNIFLGIPFHFYGFSFFGKILRGEDIFESPQFPRVTMCDFYVREVGRVHHYTIQCVLQVNLFNEKIFLFLWFWFILMSVLTGISLVRWILRIFVLSHKEEYIRRGLAPLKDTQTFKDKSALRTFIGEYLQDDGHFVMRMVSSNVSDIVASEILSGLWGAFVKRCDMVKSKKEGLVHKFPH